MALVPRDHHISVQAAAALTKRHRDARPSETKGSAFHKDQVLALLDQKGCVGMRVYFGREADGSLVAVLTGIDAADNDLTASALEYGYPCPPYCGATNALNT